MNSRAPCEGRPRSRKSSRSPPFSPRKTCGPIRKRPTNSVGSSAIGSEGRREQSCRSAEFHSVADAILRAELYDVLGEFAVAGGRREPSENFWRFYEIVARTRNDPGRMSIVDEDALDRMCKSRVIAEDRLGRSRIDRYLDGTGDDANSKRRARRREADDEARSFDLFENSRRRFPPVHVSARGEETGKSQGRDGAAATLVDRLAKLPLGAGAPRMMLELAAKAMVLAALGEELPRF